MSNPLATHRGHWASWRWDDTLFADAAPHYVKGRLPYSPGLADAMARSLDLDGRGRLLDVGCGPGVVALQLAHLFEAVVGLDPDAGMLAEASRLADEQHITNAHWVKLRAERLRGQLGNFRVVTFAASFHWMDRPRVATAVRSLLEPGGAAIQVHAPAYLADATAATPLPYPAPPTGLIDELRQRYLGPDRRAGRGIRNSSPDGEDAVFQAAGFLPAETVSVPDGRTLIRTVDHVVANVFSSSSTVPGLFGPRRVEFETDLRALLASVSPADLFSVRLPDNWVRIWRPASGT